MYKLLKVFCDSNSIDLDIDSIIGKVDKYIELYLKWKKNLSLSSIADKKKIFIYHFLDSFSLNLLSKTGSFADIGSGAGFPGLAFALSNSNVTVISIEKNRKKVHFQERVRAELKLFNVKLFHGDFNHFKCDEKINNYVFRAIDKRSKIIAKLLSLKEESSIVYFGAKEEPSDLTASGLILKKRISYFLPEPDLRRELIVFQPRKVKNAT